MEQIIIKHSGGTETPLFSRKHRSAASKATQKTALLADDLVQLTVVSAEPLPLAIGDRAVIFGKTYKVNEAPELTKDGERAYEYNVKLEGLQYDLIGVHYHLPEDAYGETYYSDLKGHLIVLIWNANRIYPGKWVLGECPEETEYKNITNTEKNCLQVLQELCGEYGMEFEITTNGDVNTVSIKQAVGVTHPFVLHYGRGKGLYRLQRTNVNNAGITNRVYYYGGTDNLGSGYPHTKLVLPGATRLTSYLEDQASIQKYGLREGEKNYPDIKPERVGEVTALGADEITFSDGTMFDLNARDSNGTLYLIDGTSAKLKFQDGELAGYEFDVHSYNHTTHTFVINRYKDENGLVFPSADPNGAFRIAVGNKYILTDIQLPAEYKTAAENKLNEEATKHLPTVSSPQVSYKLELTEGFFVKMYGKGEAEVFHVGDYIQVEDEEIGINRAVRITAIERDILRPHTYNITLSDTVTKTIASRVLNDITSINEIIAINKLADPAKARRNWMAAQELLNMVFDPEGDYYSEKIKPLSIETQMLSVGAKSTQFTLLNIKFEANYGGNPNVLKITSNNGRLAHYAIDPTGVRYWSMASVTFSGMPGATAYYLYARCSKTGETGSFLINAQPIAVEAAAGYYTFLVGVLNSAVVETTDNKAARLLSLTYGSSTINGRFIKTGRIESSGGGSCYFDLDNNEIGGILKFRRSDGTYHNVTDVEDQAQATADYINGTLPGVISDLTQQIDGKIDTWYQESDPSEAWTTATERAAHVGDMWYNTSTNELKRYSASYSWELITDAQAIAAYQAASHAQDTADGKRRVFTATPVPPYDAGDLWTQGTNGDLLVCVTPKPEGGTYSRSDWKNATKYTDDTALNSFITGTFAQTVTRFENQIDGKIESWFQASDPATAWTTTAEKDKHVGDMWYNTTAKTLSRYVKNSNNTYEWKRIEDATALSAYEAASNAQATADGKMQVFVSQPTTPYDIGDLWLRSYTANGVAKKELWRCVTKRLTGNFNVNDWAEAVYYDNTKTTIDGGIVTSGTVQLAGSDAAIKAGITGDGTADESVRIWAGATYGNRTSAPFRVLQNGKFIATNGEITGKINANSGSIGGFKISSGSIGADNDNTSNADGLALLNEFIRFYSGDKKVFLGTYQSPYTLATCLMQLTNNTSNPWATNRGAIISVTGGQINQALWAKGGILSDTHVIGYGFAEQTPYANNCTTVGDAWTPTPFVVKAKFIYDNSGIGLPTKSSVQNVLGISSSTKFAVRFTLICDAASTKTGFVTGRNTFVTGTGGTHPMDTADYPYRLNNNGDKETGKSNMAAGDIREFLLVYDGTNYYAYTLNWRE